MAAGETLSIDPVSEDAANVVFELQNPAGGVYLMDLATPTPPRDIQWVGSADTEGQSVGSTKYQNREITIKVRVRQSTAAARDQTISQLEQKVAKINREGGTLKRIVPGSNYEITFDLLDGEADPVFGNAYIHSFRSEVEIKLVAKPFWRQAPIQLSDHVETTNPELIWTDGGLTGDVNANGLLRIDEDSGNDQAWLCWGVQSQHYSSSADAALAYTAISRTALGTSTTAANGTAFGASTNVVRNTDLTTTYQAIMSTQATGGGAHLSHVGVFKILARLFRPTGNTGAVSVRFSSSEGDFRKFTVGRSVDYAVADREGVMTIADLGLVYLSETVQGTQQWQGRIEAKSTVVGDEVDINRLWVVPAGEGYGEVRALPGFESPTSLSARDEFNQAVTGGSDPLAGVTAPVGGVWAGAGDADDFVVEDTGHTAQRTAVSDTNYTSGRFAISGVSAMTAQTVQADVKATDLGASYFGVLARYTDTSNWMTALIAPSGAIFVTKCVSGSPGLIGVAGGIPIAAGTSYSIRLVVDTRGTWRVFLDGTQMLSGSHADFATGGALASGKPGLYDAQASATASTRNYDNFAAFVPTSDAAIFASQSLELRHDRVIREDSAGTLWTPASKVEGSYLTVPPAGREGRTARFFVKVSRNDPDYGSDPAVDDTSARLTYTPRGLEVSAA